MKITIKVFARKDGKGIVGEAAIPAGPLAELLKKQFLNKQAPEEVVGFYEDVGEKVTFQIEEDGTSIQSALRDIADMTWPPFLSMADLTATKDSLKLVIETNVSDEELGKIVVENWKRL